MSSGCIRATSGGMFLKIVLDPRNIRNIQKENVAVAVW